ncbi:MAG: hypothetical protein COA49_01575 [Bacteroidetes bacterium]|nr:MAG: hypothetical protein COA49_01575 [Bacteroidota bacterium]
MKFTHLLLFVSVFFSTFLCALGQNEEIEVWPISSVEVHQAGALIEHSSLVLLRENKIKLVIPGISHGVDLSTIQIDLPEGVSISKIDYEEREKPNSRSLELSGIKDSIYLQTVSRKMHEAIKQTLVSEQKFLEANRSIGSDNEVLLVDDVAEMADFLRVRNKEIALDILETELDIDKVNLIIRKLTNRKLNLERIQADKEGVVNVVLNIAKTYVRPQEIKFRYLSPSAFWSTDYEVIFNSKQIQVKRYALISQASGSDWSSVPITLISGKPSGTLSPINFGDWVLSTLKPNKTSRNDKSYGVVSYNMPLIAKDSDDTEVAVMEDFDSGSISESEEVSFAGSSRYIFDLETSATITGDGELEKIVIDEFELDGEVRYYAVPALKSEAYTTVRVADFSGHKLMNGYAQVISNNSYLGKFYLDIPSVGDTLIMPLGPNPYVRCSRELSEETSTSSILSGKRQVVSNWKLSVENFLSDSISIDLVDLVPRVSARNLDVDVSISLSEGGRLDEINNLVTFALELGPQERREVTITITVVYPRNSILYGL